MMNVNPETTIRLETTTDDERDCYGVKANELGEGFLLGKNQKYGRL